jgi:hypothetical protein
MKLLKIFILSINILLFLASCHKIIDTNLTPPKEIAVVENLRNSARSLVSTTDPTYANYVILTFSQLANQLNRDSSYKIDAYARFSSGGQNLNVGAIGIGDNITMVADADNLYHYQFPLSEGTALFGTSLSMGVTEPNPESRGVASRSQTIMLVPNQIFPLSVSFPSSVIDRMAVLPLTWAPDPNNQFGKVQIDVTYYSGQSKHNATSMPNSVTSLSYQVTDNGSFSIPAADLNRFPRDSYIGISIARVWSITSANNVSYVAYVEGRTIPLLVVSSGPLVVDFTQQSPAYFAVRLDAVVNGGVPPFTYEWRRRSSNAAPWSSVLTTNSSYNFADGCSNGSTTAYAFFQLKVTDNLGNSQTIQKQASHRCPR